MHFSSQIFLPEILKQKNFSAELCTLDTFPHPFAHDIFTIFPLHKITPATPFQFRDSATKAPLSLSPHSTHILTYRAQ
jgi:hypothetical protein